MHVSHLFCAITTACLSLGFSHSSGARGSRSYSEQTRSSAFESSAVVFAALLMDRRTSSVAVIERLNVVEVEREVCRFSPWAEGDRNRQARLSWNVDGFEPRHSRSRYFDDVVPKEDV